MRLRLRIVSGVGFAAVALTSAPAFAAVDVTGLWSVADGKAEIAISECGDTLCGKLVSARKIESNPDIVDKKNKNPSLRLRKLKGITVLAGFAGGPLEWSNGTIYNPEDGGTYRATLKLVDEDNMRVAGCIVWPLCRSTKLTRLHGEEAGKGPGFSLANRGE